MQSQLTDLNNAVKVMQLPAAPPPAQPGSPQVAPPGGAEPVAAMPPISATDLFANAQRDRSGGHYDLALQEYADYLKYYGNTSQAPSAQFYIGLIDLSCSWDCRGE